jgi:UDPglucose 6-dehydrogenase
MRIAMIGTGYVGLVSGACFADFGHQVTCVDKDAGKIASLRRGEIPIFEPGLDALVSSNVKAGRLDFATDLVAAVGEAEAVFIAVGTPSRRGDGHADLTYVYAAAREIAAVLKDFTVVVTKSTVPVGTGDEVERLIHETNPSADVAVASNPEFLREGAAIRDFKFPDRIVIGTSDERARKVLTDIYRPLSLNQAPLMFTARRTAELIKYAANAFLATKITFINEIADLAEKVGADVQEVARGIGLDNRIGSKFLHAGPGFGGKIPARWSRSRSIMTCRCGSSKRCWRSTTTASARWRARFPRPPAAACAARSSPCSALPSSPTPMTCVRRPRFRW